MRPGAVQVIPQIQSPDAMLQPRSDTLYAFSSFPCRTGRIPYPLVRRDAAGRKPKPTPGSPQMLLRKQPSARNHQMKGLPRRDHATDKYRMRSFCADQKLQTVLRCHVSAFEVCGGAMQEVLYGRMKAAVLGENADGTAVYKPSLIALLDNYGSVPRVRKACRTKTKDKMERPFCCIRQDFFPYRTFRKLDDLKVHSDKWRGKLASPPRLRHDRPDRRESVRRRAISFDSAAGQKRERRQATERTRPEGQSGAPEGPRRVRARRLPNQRPLRPQPLPRLQGEKKCRKQAAFATAQADPRDPCGPEEPKALHGSRNRMPGDHGAREYPALDPHDEGLRHRISGRQEGADTTCLTNATPSASGSPAGHNGSRPQTPFNPGTTETRVKRARGPEDRDVSRQMGGSPAITN